MKELLSPELEMCFLKNQLSWWKNWAIHQTCMAVLCRENKGVLVPPNDQMLEMTQKELEQRCEDEILKAYEEHCRSES